MKEIKPIFKGITHNVYCTKDVQAVSHAECFTSITLFFASDSIVFFIIVPLTYACDAWRVDASSLSSSASRTISAP
jgi:hypothetical protein